MKTWWEAQRQLRRSKTSEEKVERLIFDDWAQRRSARQVTSSNVLALEVLGGLQDT